jgi:hypothetical protein
MEKRLESHEIRRGARDFSPDTDQDDGSVALDYPAPGLSGLSIGPVPTNAPPLDGAGPAARGAPSVESETALIEAIKAAERRCAREWAVVLAAVVEFARDRPIEPKV